MQDQFGNYVLKMNSIGQYYPRGDGGGGSGALEIFSGHGLIPDVTPEGDTAIWIDKDTGIIIHFYDGEWQIGQDNLNTVTWGPSNLTVDYDVGAGTVTATLAEFNLVDPATVIRFAIENLGLDTIANLDELVNLQELRLSGNDIAELPALPSTITLLDVSNNDLDLAGLGSLPPALVQLFIGNNILLEQLPALPATLLILDAPGCSLDSVAGIGLSDITGSVIINVANNALTGFPDLPPNITQLSIQNNDLSAVVSWNGASGGLLNSLNATDCGMTTPGSVNLVEFVAITTFQQNGTLSMLGNDPPTGAEAFITVLENAGWTVLVEP